MEESGRATPTSGQPTTLARELGLLALVATAVCTVIGGGINVLTVGIQGKVPGIGPYVPLAFVLGVVPAVLAALCYAILASAMPHAGGGYIYASRGLHPFLGFMATFSKWIGLSAATGVLAYMDVALLASGIGYLDPYLSVSPAVAFLISGTGKLVVGLVMIWLFWLINLLGVRTYGWVVILLMIFELAGGLVVIATGLLRQPGDFAAAFASHPGAIMTQTLAKAGLAGKSVAEIAAAAAPSAGGLLRVVLATTWIFFAYIGFCTISQAGGEARNPRRLLPRAFLLATLIICSYYLLFSWSVYRLLPWRFVAGFVAAASSDVSVPLLIGILLPPALASFVALMAGLSLANDLPPMLMSSSRLFFAWANDGVFPRSLAAVNSRFRTPHWALTTSGILATAFLVACYRWESYFAGVDTVIIAFTFTYLVVSASVLTLPHRSPQIAGRVAFIRSRPAQILVACSTIAVLLPLLVLEISLLEKPSTVFWLGAMCVGGLIFLIMWLRAGRLGQDLHRVFSTLPTAAEEEPEEF